PLLPLVGAVPQPGARHEQARRIARMPGLLVCTALGSRGITWAPLAAELLAAWVTGGPPPLESDLVDALDPARFAARRARKQL
ncbi:MAG: oxidoreductase, partial [Aquincola sp.]|nr:oxidoreductase [Aquincola sp.]